jgi:ClpP class serine protease
MDRQPGPGRGLIDNTGTCSDALKQAATRAKLHEQARLRWIERDPASCSAWPGCSTRAWPQAFGWNWRAAGPGPGCGLGRAAGARALSAQAREDLSWLLESVERRAPHAAFVHCLCRVEP